jgi:mannose-6-phosphate isomerase
MSQIPLYPLRFEPIYQYRLWGGRRLAKLLCSRLPGSGPIGEAWVLSDRDDHPSRVANGPLRGQTIAQLMAGSQEELLGRFAGRFSRFPLLLKFLDARDTLSVQVHPSDTQTKYLPAGETGKTEAWIVLEAGSESRVYAGLKPATTADVLRRAITSRTVADRLASFKPKVGDGVFLEAGTVHSLGDLVVFEVQENSDVTFRLFDWDHIETKTRQRRALQVDQAMACIDFARGPVRAVAPVVEQSTPVLRERLFLCDHFGMWRLQAEAEFVTGVKGTPRVLVCIEGSGQLEHESVNYSIGKGDVLLMPAVAGACVCRPCNGITLLEISLPEGVER